MKAAGIVVSCVAVTALAACTIPVGDPTAPASPSATTSASTATPSAATPARSMVDVAPMQEAIDALGDLRPDMIVVEQQTIEAWFGGVVASFDGSAWTDLPEAPEVGNLDPGTIDVDALPDIVRASSVPCAPPIVIIDGSPAGPLWRLGCEYMPLLLRQEAQWFTNEREELTTLRLSEPDGLDTAIRQAAAGSDGNIAHYFIVFGEVGDSFVEVAAAHDGTMLNVRRTARDWEWPVMVGSSHIDYSAAPTFRADEVPAALMLERFQEEAASAGLAEMATAYVWVGESGDILGRVVGPDSVGTSPEGFVLLPADQRG